MRYEMSESDLLRKKIIEARHIETMAAIMITLGIIVIIVLVWSFKVGGVSNIYTMWATIWCLFFFTGILLIICGGILGIYYSNKKETFKKEHSVLAEREKTFMKDLDLLLAHAREEEESLK